MMALGKDINISTQQANSANTKLKSHTNELKNRVNKLNTKVTQLTNSMAGETTNAFIESFRRAKNAFDKELAKLEAHGENMVKSVQRQQEHDQAMARSIARH